MDLATASPAALFKQWRSGDGAAGQAMAQRFSDWYYAITTCRLGDEHGRGPLQRACVRFQQGILSVTTAPELVDWAHGIVVDEVGMAGGRIAGGDFPSRLTNSKSPTELLKEVARQLSADEVRLLSAAYDTNVALEEVQQEAEAMGGYPLAVLQARLTLKRALRDKSSVAFTEVPDSPNLDLAPLPLYEAGRMGTAAEESGFEKWMLTNMPLCKDIAEFGVFAQALRAGAFRGLAVIRKPDAAQQTETAAADGTPEEEAPPSVGVALPVALVVVMLLGGVALAALGLAIAFGGF